MVKKRQKQIAVVVLLDITEVRIFSMCLWRLITPGICWSMSASAASLAADAKSSQNNFRCLWCLAGIAVQHQHLQRLKQDQHLSSAKNYADSLCIQEHLQQLLMTQWSQILEQNSTLPQLSHQTLNSFQGRNYH